jgi:hypothetical protein
VPLLVVTVQVALRAAPVAVAVTGAAETLVGAVASFAAPVAVATPAVKLTVQVAL